MLITPARPVLIVEGEAYGVGQFSVHITPETGSDLDARLQLREKCKNKRSLARLLASTDVYGGNRFQSCLADYFGVSLEAMAIRLDELELLEY
jgi:hypothetical protein